MRSGDAVGRIQRHLELLLRMSSSRRVYNKQAEAAGVTISQPAYALLRRIQRDGPLSMGDLARRTHMDPGATARQVGQLERDGLVRRSPSPDDGRVSLVVVTPYGERLQERVARVMNSHMYGVLAGWPERDRQQFAELFGRFVEDLRASEYAPEATQEPA